MTQPTITLPAFAKINWSLRVLGRRADGYHELETVMQTISLHDTITVTLANDAQISLSCDDRSLPIDATNLVSRAATALQARYSVRTGATIRLRKRTPMQAGLGGGSADAAITLLALSRLWDTGASHTELIEIAAALGADVPFFLFGGVARATGTGATVTALPDEPEESILVLKPNAGISTARAYESLKAPSLTSSASDTILSSSPGNHFRDRTPGQWMSNDLEPVVSGLEPEIARAKSALMMAGATSATLSGSGSAVFGIFDNQEMQERAVAAIELEAGWRVFPCTTVGRDQYRRALGPDGAMLLSAPGDLNAGA